MSPAAWGRYWPNGLLVLFGAMLAGLPLAARADPPAGQEITPAEASQDPDVPGFLDGLIDKELYLQLRAGALDEYRGLPYTPVAGGPANPRGAAIKKMEAQQQKQLSVSALAAMGLPPANWESVGPAPIPNGQTSTRSDPVSGRTTAITVDPTDADVAYVGTAQGGVYRTLDGGATWTAIFDSAQSLAIGAIAIAPSDPGIVYVGTGEANLSGDSFFGVGVYRIDSAKTTADLTGPINPSVTFNGGIVTTGAFTGRAISKIVVHPTNPATIFVASATGIAGLGSTSLEAATAVPPLGILGVYRSTNATAAAPTFQKLSLGLASATRRFVADATSENSRITDLVFEPGNPNVLLAAVMAGVNLEGGVYRSINALVATPTFTRTLNPGLNAIRIELAINKVGSTVTVIAATGEPSTFAGSTCSDTFQSGAVRRSVDGGATWSLRLPGGAPGFCGGQCSYDIAVAMDPSDANLVYLGGSANNTCSRVHVRSANGGNSFVSADDGLHADSHALVVAPSDPSVVYIGNDGGIWKSTDAAQTWTSLNNAGFNATQFQSLALHPIDRELMIGGTQDNGTQLRRPDATWFRADFGDGGFALIDQGATDTLNVTMYHTYFNQPDAMGFGRVTRTSDAYDANWTLYGCGFSGAIANGLNCSPAASSILFYAPMALGPGTPNTLYFGSDRLFRSTDRGQTMVLASQHLQPGPPAVAVSALGISPQDDNVRLVGMRLGRVFGTHNGSSTLVDVGGAVPPWPVSPSLASQPRRFVSRAVIDPTNTNVAYVTFATYCAPNGVPAAGCAQVYKTSNLVTALAAATTPTWAPANAGIPDVPVNAFVVDPRDPSQLFAGTDIGVYRSGNGGTTWAPFGTGFPRVSVFDMALHAPSGTLRVATHGRGIWEIAAGLATPAFSGLASPTIGAGGGPTLLSGFVRAGSLVPPGSVDITLDGVTLSASISPATGFFSSAFATSSLGAGTYPITYDFAGASGYLPVLGGGTLAVSASLTPTSLAIDAPAAVYPNGTATVTVTSPAGTPTGNVRLRVDGGADVTLALLAGSAVFAVPTVTVGTHELQATFEAQGAFGGSAAISTLTITKATPVFGPTPVTIALGQTPSVVGGTLGVAGVFPTGTVDVSLNGVTQTASLSLADGSFGSSFATGGLGVGTYPIALAYSGDATFEAASGASTLAVTPVFTTTTFANTAGITINDLATAAPSPSVINVSLVSGNVLQASVTLKGVTHTFLGDTAFLLVAPGGTTTALLFHAGGSSSVSGIDLALDDGGAALPGLVVAGTYRPTQAGTVTDFQTGSVPGPDATAAPYGITLFAHNAAGPNGDWKLYVQDDAGGDAGSVAGGWELHLVTAPLAGASIDDVAVSEGGDAVFTVTLSSPPAFAVDIDYEATSGSAISGPDFTPASGTVHFEPLETSKTITVTTLLDATGELEETFLVDLTNPRGSTLGDAQGLGTILDADPHATLGDVQRAEGNGGWTPFRFTITLDAPPAAPVSVRYVTETVDATPGRDYTHVSGTLAFAAGETTKTVSVPVLGDRVEERDEFFKLVLRYPTGGLYLDRSEALGSIVNDDFTGPPRVTISDASLVEGNAGLAAMAFTVRLSRVAASVLSVPYSTANGTASAGDYTAQSGRLGFPIGVTEGTILVPILGDLTDETDETFFVNLGLARGVSYLDRQGRGTIVDDDP